MDIAELLPPDRVLVGIQAEDWEDAVRKIGRVLVDTQVVEERYIEGMINTCKELGPYIVIAPGLAIPHGRPEDGVLEPCLAVGLLEPPIPFGNEENDPVRVMIALGATDAVQHVEALRQIAETLSDEEKFNSLKDATSKNQVLDILWSASKTDDQG
ncbi:MAG: PTS sugar transporter subunit IIA [Anaerolineales bacterium]|nr:MAG: PTS sugar transporter subunit IIA [Anaerolineales bacterium]